VQELRLQVEEARRVALTAERGLTAAEDHERSLETTVQLKERERIRACQAQAQAQSDLNQAGWQLANCPNSDASGYAAAVSAKVAADHHCKKVEQVVLQAQTVKEQAIKDLLAATGHRVQAACQNLTSGNQFCQLSRKLSQEEAKLVQLSYSTPSPRF
jgi:hypothetical protein